MALPLRPTRRTVNAGTAHQHLDGAVSDVELVVTLIHSDQGTVFGSWACAKRAQDAGLVPSMGSVGDCYDNSMIESFWSRMQVELLDTKRWRTRVELANAIFDYLEVWHNHRRRHSQLGMLYPIELERNQSITVA